LNGTLKTFDAVDDNITPPVQEIGIENLARAWTAQGDISKELATTFKLLDSCPDNHCTLGSICTGSGVGDLAAIISGDVWHASGISREGQAMASMAIYGSFLYCLTKREAVEGRGLMHFRSQRKQGINLGRGTSLG